MKKSGVTVILLLIIPLILPAHGVEVSFRFASPFVELTCLYSGGLPLKDGSVTLQFVGDESTFQRGYTDQLGHFSFRPDRIGEWIVLVDDGLGHRKKTTIHVGALFLNPNEETTEAEKPIQADPGEGKGKESTGSNKTLATVPNWFRLLLGLSLILNITLFLILRSGKKRHET